MFARSMTVGCCFVTCCGLIGCGRTSTLERVEVRGKVVYAGNPVENGEIRFFPVEGTKGPVSGAPIVDGKFEITQRGGVPVGSHRVEVEAFRSSRAYPELNTEGGHREQFLPQKYNIITELKVTVPGGRPVFAYDLDLPK